MPESMLEYNGKLKYGISVEMDTGIRRYDGGVWLNFMGNQVCLNLTYVVPLVTPLAGFGSIEPPLRPGLK